MAATSCVLACDFGSERVTFGLFEGKEDKVMLCRIVHIESYSIHVQQQQQQPPHPRPAIDAMLQAFQKGMDWLSARALTQSVSTMTFTSSAYLPVLLNTNIQDHLPSSCTASKPLHTLAKDILALSSDLHATLLWSCHEDSSIITTTLEDAFAASLEIKIIDPVCQTALPTLCAEGEVTRRQLQKMQATRTGTMLGASTLPVRLVGLTKKLPAAEVKAMWQKVGRVTSLPGLVIALLTGSVPRTSAVEAVQTGCWNIQAQEWDDDLLRVTSDAVRMQCERGKEDTSTRLPDNFLAALLPSADNAYADQVQMTPSMATRFNLPTTCKVSTAVLPTLIASYLSHLPNYNDLGVQLGPHEDWLVLPTSTLMPDVDRVIVPNPVFTQTDDSSRSHTQPYLALCRMTGAGEARLAVRNRYTNGNWSAFGRMTGVVCAGGSVGMDNKYYTIHNPEEPIDPTSSNLKRYEGGTRVVEFSDLRANTRCLIEGQGATIRAFVGRVLTSDRRAAASTNDCAETPIIPRFSSSVDFANGTNKYTKACSPNQFDPYDIGLSPLRILAWSEEDIGAHAALAECLTNIVGGRWVAVAGSKNRYASGSTTASRVEDASAWKGLGARQHVQGQGRPMAYPPAAPLHGRGPSQECLLASILAAQEQPIVDVALDQVSNRALVGSVFFALALGAHEEKKTFNEFAATLLKSGSPVAALVDQEPKKSNPPSDDSSGDQAKSTTPTTSTSTPTPTRTRARSSSSPLLMNNPPTTPATPTLPGHSTTPSVSFDVPDNSVNAATRRRAVSTSITPTSVVDDIRRRRSASSLSMQAAAARQGVLSFSILEEGEEEGSGGTSSAATSSQGGVAVTRERSQSQSVSTGVEVTSNAAASPVAAPRNRAVSMMAHEVSIGRRSGGGVSSSKNAPDKATSTSRLTRMSSSSSVGTTASRTAIVSSPIDDDDTPHERAMRAWLQGQLSEPPPVPGAFPASSSSPDSVQTVYSRTPTASSTFSSPSHSQSSSYAQRERSISLSSTTMPSSPPVEVEQAHAQAVVVAPPAASSQDRLAAINTENAANEELLGLQTMAKADEDVWMVYGALSEEYLRLKSWTGGLQGSLGELASMW